MDFPYDNEFVNTNRFRIYKIQKHKEGAMHNPTERVLKILEYVSVEPGRTMSEISKALGIPVGTIHPIMQTLAAWNFLTLAKDNTYSMGLRAYLTGLSFVSEKDSFDVAKNILRHLTEVTGETSHMAMLDGGNVLYLAKIDSPQPIRMFSAIGKQLPAYGTGLGKALISDMGRDEIEALYPEGMSKLTDNTIADIDTLMEELESIRKTGFAYETEESTLNVRCIARPVRQDGRIRVAISVSIPTFRWNDELKKKTEKALAAAAAETERILPQLNIR